MAHVMAYTAGIRRYGAAALDLAYVAAGRFDIYWERGLSSWDIAAGAILVREAGGYISDVNGRDTYMGTGNVLAGNEAMQKELIGLLKKAQSV
jgi:myo-inositol-1(or 4)-monophosphatase